MHHRRYRTALAMACEETSEDHKNPRTEHPAATVAVTSNVAKVPPAMACTTNGEAAVVRVHQSPAMTKVTDGVCLPWYQLDERSQGQRDHERREREIERERTRAKARDDRGTKNAAGAQEWRSASEGELRHVRE